ncbi:MAG: hypothetical protein ACI4LS_03565 [Treponema sp.]
MKPSAFLLRNPVIQIFYHIFNQDYELVSQLPTYYTTYKFRYQSSEVTN